MLDKVKLKPKSDICVIVPIMVLVVGCWLATPVLVCRMYGSVDNPGIFGDLYGSINALFSGLAFALLIWTIMLQRKELSFQREELAQNTKELKNQAVALNKQLRVMQLTAKLNSLPTLLTLEYKRLHKLSSGLGHINEATDLEEVQEELNRHQRGLATEREVLDALKKANPNARDPDKWKINRKIIDSLERICKLKTDQEALYDRIETAIYSHLTDTDMGDVLPSALMGYKGD